MNPDRDSVSCVWETFGVGGIPDYEDQSPSFKEAIDSWVESGRTIVLTTQVPEEGCDMGVYEVGRAYAKDRKSVV